jgi:hypothetical protein
MWFVWWLFAGLLLNAFFAALYPSSCGTGGMGQGV